MRPYGITSFQKHNHLHPWVLGAQLLNQLRPSVNHSLDLTQLHQREGDVRPGVEAHHLAPRQTVENATCYKKMPQLILESK